jgi:hypothetical protein
LSEERYLDSYVTLALKGGEALPCDRVLIAAIAGCGDQTNGVLQGYAEGEYLRIASPIAGQLARYRETLD